MNWNLDCHGVRISTKFNEHKAAYVSEYNTFSTLPPHGDIPIFATESLACFDNNTWVFTQNTKTVSIFDMDQKLKFFWSKSEIKKGVSGVSGVSGVHKFKLFPWRHRPLLKALLSERFP